MSNINPSVSINNARIVNDKINGVPKLTKDLNYRENPVFNRLLVTFPLTTNNICIKVAVFVCVFPDINL